MSQQSVASLTDKPTQKFHRHPNDDIRHRGTLIPGEYKSKDLTNFLVENAKKTSFDTNLTNEESDSLFYFPTTITQSIAVVGRFLKTFFPIFDKIFFFGSRETYFPAGDLVARDRESFIRNEKEMSGGYFSAGEGAIYMCLDQGDQVLPGTLPQAYIASLVHEMLHAFLVQYTCQCDHCESEDVSGQHGYQWAKVMATIEQALVRNLNWQIEGYCHIHQSLIEEILDGHDTLLSDDQLSQLGFPPINPAKRVAIQAWLSASRPGFTTEAGT